MTKPVLPADLAQELDPATILVRGGATRSAHDETCEALFMTSGFVYDTAAAAEEAFAQEGSRFVYSRYRNPTVAMFEERLRLLEGAEACRATASGMAAVFAALLCRLRAASASCRAAPCSGLAITLSPICCHAGASKRCWLTGATSARGRRRSP